MLVGGMNSSEFTFNILPIQRRIGIYAYSWVQNKQKPRYNSSFIIRSLNTKYMVNPYMVQHEPFLFLSVSEVERHVLNTSRVGLEAREHYTGQATGNQKEPVLVVK